MHVALVDRDHIYKHLGHSEDVNRNVYQVPLAIKALTVVSKGLQALDRGDIVVQDNQCASTRELTEQEVNMRNSPMILCPQLKQVKMRSSMVIQYPLQYERQPKRMMIMVWNILVGTIPTGKMPMPRSFLVTLTLSYKAKQRRNFQEKGK